MLVVTRHHYVHKASLTQRECQLINPPPAQVKQVKLCGLQIAISPVLIVQMRDGCLFDVINLGSVAGQREQAIAPPLSSCVQSSSLRRCFRWGQYP